MLRIATGINVMQKIIIMVNSSKTIKKDIIPFEIDVILEILLARPWNMYDTTREKPKGSITSKPTLLIKSQSRTVKMAADIQNFFVKPKKKLCLFIL